MALLHRVWVTRPGGELIATPDAAARPRRPVSLRSALLPLLLAALAGAGCREREQPNLNPPDTLLRDSLGLSAFDRVHRIVLGSVDGAEYVEPTDVVVQPGEYVEFFAEDRRVRTVSFHLDSLNLEQAEFLSSTGQDRSPPLLELESRFLVSFESAPSGRYPFVVDGNERSIEGVVRVEGPGSQR